MIQDAGDTVETAMSVADSLDGPDAESELVTQDAEAVPHPRRRVSKLITQQTLTGTITVRKWVSDEAPALSAKRSNGEAQTHLCPLEGCGKAFADAGSLRKHMHTHGEKQYVCQVEARPVLAKRGRAHPLAA